MNLHAVFRVALRLGVLALVSAFCLPGAFAGQTDADPMQTYTQFHDLLPAAKNLDGLSKYIAKARWDEMSRDQRTMPREQFELTFQLFKQLSPSNVSLVSQSVVGDVCILTLQSHQSHPATASEPSLSGSGTGTVTMRKEDGLWKIEREEWQCAEVIGDKAAPEKEGEAEIVSAAKETKSAAPAP